MPTVDYNPTYDGHVQYQADCFGATDGYMIDDTGNDIRVDMFKEDVVFGCDHYLYLGCDLDSDGIPDTGTEVSESECTGDYGGIPIYDPATCDVPNGTGRRKRFRGFLKFSGVTLPRGSITKLELIWTLNAIEVQEDIFYTNLGTYNPQGADAATLYSNIGSGSLFTTGSYSGTGSKTVDLGAAAITQLRSNGTFFYIGMYCNSVVDGGGGPATSGYRFTASESSPDPILRITYHRRSQVI